MSYNTNKLVIDTQMDTHTQRKTQAMTIPENPKLALGKNAVNEARSSITIFLISLVKTKQKLWD